MIALVERRSWMNSGSVGTSKERRSALPAQFRNGRPSARSFSAAAFASGRLPASRMARSRASPCSRAGFWPSQSRAGESEES